MSRPQNCGFLSLLYSVGEKPLNLWCKHVSLEGRIRRVEDEMLRGDKVIEIMGPLQTPVPTNIACPANPKDVLNIKLPILVLVVKNLELIFKVEFQLIDKLKHRRQFSLTTHNIEKPPQSIHPNAAYVPLKLDEGWNNLEINLQTLCNEVYKTDYQAIQRIIVFPNCRLRRVYFQDRHYDHDETPVELCQAFFDMYMLKWGIHLVERSCQTEEIYTGLLISVDYNKTKPLSISVELLLIATLNLLRKGPLHPYELEYFATESNISISVMTASLSSNDDCRTNEIKRIMRKDADLAMALGKNDIAVLRNDFKSINQFGKRTKTISNYEFKLPSSKCSSAINNGETELTFAMSKRKIKSANSGEKDRERRSEYRMENCKDRIQFRDKLASCNSEAESLSFREKKGVTKSFPHIEKSQYLRKEIGENFLSSNLKRNDENSAEQPTECDDKIKSNRIVENNVQSKCQSDTKRNAGPNYSKKNFAPTKCRSSNDSKNQSVPSSKADSKTSIKKPKPGTNSSTVLKKIETYQGDGLLSHSVRAIEEVINEVQRIREQLNGTDEKISFKETNEASTDFSYDVPSVVDTQATPYEEQCEKAVLATDMAVCDFLELRHAVNRKILEKLKDKGLTITEVELSIYNSKNRRNCYGQGKIVESWKGSNDKGSGLSSIEPVRTHISLKKERLSLNDKICIQLRNELDAALLKLRSTQVRVTSKMVDDTIGNILKDECNGSKSGFFTVQEAKYIKRKVCNESMMKCVKETVKQTENFINSEYQINDFIKNLDKYSGMEIVNILFQRQTHDSEAEYRSK